MRVILLGLVLLTLLGCAMFPVGGGATGGNTISISTPANQLWQAARQTNWLVTVSIIIIAFGAVAFFQGMVKLGTSAALFGCVTLFLSLATARFALWMAVFGLVGAVAVVAASILLKNRALVEMISGTQKLKEGLNKDESNKILSKPQSKSTQKLVQTIKTNLKLKGRL